MKLRFWAGLVLAGALAGLQAGAMTVESPSGRLEIDEATGGVTGVWASSSAERLVSSGKKGLWLLDFDRAVALCANEAKFAGVEKTATGATLSWTHPRADVTVRIVTRPDGFEWTGEVVAKAEPVTEFICPADLRFAPESVARFVAPHTRIDGYGYAFNSGYFRKSADWVTGWSGKGMEGRGWKRLFDGKFPALRDPKSPAEPVKVTDEGRKFLSAEAVSFVERTPVPVLRPPVKGQYDVAWTESKSGPLVSGTHFGGKGTFWRLGTMGLRAGRTVQEELLRHYAEGTLRASAAVGGARKKVGLIRLQNGQTWLIGFSLDQFADQVRDASGRLGLKYVELVNPKAIAAAEASGEFAAIVNPYEEHLPVEKPEDFDSAVDAVAAYVRAGGNWIECGGASFFLAYLPNPYFSRRITYPTAFLDLQRLETASGAAVTLYGVQPRPPHEPWKAKRRFQVAILEHGADEKGGYFRHGHCVYVKKGERYAPPSVRMRLDGALDALLGEYAEANTLDRKLRDKIRPETLEKLVHGVFLKSCGTAKELRGIVGKLPPSTTLHLACYLKGGFDKEYPDHLPVSSRFGTDEEFRALVDELHAAGHLFSPYTNPTWWCDHPRGPSFVAAGEAPLLVRRDGSRSHEVYGRNDGWTVTFWHPAVQAANRRTVKSFAEDFPCDLLFQDQTGGRGAGGLDFNPAAPAPDAYCEGLLSQIEEDSARLPLGCEDGWDRVANADLAIFGTTFQLIPTQERAQRSHNVLIKNSIPPNLWTIEPLSAKLMHDKTLFYLHDLGEFVWDRRGLAWCMGLGINLSYNLYVCDWNRPGCQTWLGQLARIQREAMSRIAGKRLTSFVHDRAPLFARGIDPLTRLDDGTIVSVWEDVEVRANLGDVPRQVGGEKLEPYGWTVRWPGGSLASRDVFSPIPEPRPVKSAVEITALYYPGTEHMPEWDMVEQTRPEIKPLLGWYDEGNPEVVDWQIKWAVEHGIGSFCVDWYWNKGEQRLDHWVKAYYRAKFRKYLKWYLMYANHNAPGSHSTEDQVALSKWWIDNYFTTPEYYTIDGKPVVVMWDTAKLDADFIAEAAKRGERLRPGEGAKRAFAITERMAKAAGLKGVCWIDMYHGRSYLQDKVDFARGIGCEAQMIYNFDAVAFDLAAEARKPTDTRKRFSYDLVQAAIPKWWEATSRDPKFPFWPMLPTGWDVRPRYFQRSLAIVGRTPEKFREVCAACRAFCEKKGFKRVVIAPINEWQEGSYIEPNEEYGFGMYDAIRDAFCEKPAGGWPKNVTPKELGLGPYDYPKMARSVVQEWTFDNSTEGWYRQPYGCQKTYCRNGSLWFLTSFDDNFQVRQRLEPFAAAKYGAFRLRMKVSLNPAFGLGRFAEKGARLRLKWGTTAVPVIRKDLSVDFDRSVVSAPIVADGEWHEYSVGLAGNPDWTGDVNELWLEAVNAKHAIVEIDWMRFDGATRDREPSR